MRDQCAHALDLFQLRHLRITPLGQPLDAFVGTRQSARSNAALAASNGSSARCSSGLKPSAFLDSCVRHVAPAQSLAVALGQPAGRVHQRRPRSHQSRPAPGSRSGPPALSHGDVSPETATGDRSAPSAPSVCASGRSSFFRLCRLSFDSPDQTTLRACAMGHVVAATRRAARLTHGECIPVSARDPTVRQGSEHLFHGLWSCAHALFQQCLAGRCRPTRNTSLDRSPRSRPSRQFLRR